MSPKTNATDSIWQRLILLIFDYQTVNKDNTHEQNLRQQVVLQTGFKRTPLEGVWYKEKINQFIYLFFSV